MSEILTNTAPLQWTAGQKFALRTAFIFVVFFTVPPDWGWYRIPINVDYRNIHYLDINSSIGYYVPHFINHFSESGFFGIHSFANIPFVLLIALIGATIWTFLDRKRENYNALYYWAHVLARYRLAYGLIAWGYKKIFPFQMPYPSIGELNTELIHYFAKRLYWQVTGLSAPYEIMLGFAEFIPGILLLFRRTATLGAALGVVVIGNVAIANLAYDIGEHLPATGLTLLGLFILWYDFPRIWNLLIKGKDEQVVRYYPAFDVKWQRYLRNSIKYTGNAIFVFLLGILYVKGLLANDKYKIPKIAGLKGAKGLYSVKEFKLNGKLLPYSPFDSIRWHNVTFEEFSSISILLANRPQQIDMFAAASYPRLGENYDYKWHFHIKGDERRYDPYRKKRIRKEGESRDKSITWEFAGISERHWYFYKADTVNQILYLEHKNRRDNEFKQVLHYDRPDDKTFILSGINEFNDSIYVVLKKTQQLTILEEALALSQN